LHGGKVKALTSFFLILGFAKELVSSGLFFHLFHQISEPPPMSEKTGQQQIIRNFLDQYFYSQPLSDYPHHFAFWARELPSECLLELSHRKNLAYLVPAPLETPSSSFSSSFSAMIPSSLEITGLCPDLSRVVAQYLGHSHIFELVLRKMPRSKETTQCKKEFYVEAGYTLLDRLGLFTSSIYLEFLPSPRPKDLPFVIDDKKMGYKVYPRQGSKVSHVLIRFLCDWMEECGIQVQLLTPPPNEMATRPKGNWPGLDDLDPQVLRAAVQDFKISVQGRRVFGVNSPDWGHGTFHYFDDDNKLFGQFITFCHSRYTLPGGLQDLRCAEGGFYPGGNIFLFREITLLNDFDMGFRDTRAECRNLHPPKVSVIPQSQYFCFDACPTWWVIALVESMDAFGISTSFDENEKKYWIQSRQRRSEERLEFRDTRCSPDVSLKRTWIWGSGVECRAFLERCPWMAQFFYPSSHPPCDPQVEDIEPPAKRFRKS
jgi:hypothetical protein